MRKILFLVMVLILLSTSIAPICGRDKQDDYLDLIGKIRIYFNINKQEATDQELMYFLEDEGNKIFIEATIKQIDFGQTVFGPRSESKSIEINLIEYMAKKTTLRGLEVFINNVSSLPIGTVANNLLTIHRGYEIFKKLANALAEFNQRNILYLYIHDRDNGKDEITAFNSTINDPAFEPIVNLILSLEEISTLGKTRAELKKEFWDYSEYAYQSWDLAHSRETKENIKNYILEWIRHRTEIPTPILTSVPPPTPWPTLIPPTPTPTEIPEIEPTPIPISEPTPLCDFSKPVPLRETTKYGISGDDTFDTVVCGYLKSKIDGYFVIVDFLHEDFIKSIEEKISMGNTVNKKENGSYWFNLGCLQDGEIVSGAEIDAQTQEAILNSSPERLVSIIMSFEEHLGSGCGCCNFAEKISLY